MPVVKYTLIPGNHLSELLFYISHHRSEQICSIFATEKQKYFYQFLITNLNAAYNNIQCLCFADLEGETAKAQVAGKVCVVMDVPATFEVLEKLYEGILGIAKEIILVLLDGNKKYINMINKKVRLNQIQYINSEYSPNKLVGINKKIAQLVDQSYDLNRAAFFAYGAYVNNFRANLLKFIFKTEALDVAALAKSFGFSVPPRVKEGNFLKPSVRKERIRAKITQKKKIKKQNQLKSQNQLQQGTGKKMTSTEKIRALAAKKTKLIMKNRQKITNIKVKAKQTGSAHQKPKEVKKIKNKNNKATQ